MAPIFRSLNIIERLVRNSFVFANKISEQHYKVFNGKSKFSISFYKHSKRIDISVCKSILSLLKNWKVFYQLQLKELLPFATNFFFSIINKNLQKDEVNRVDMGLVLKFTNYFLVYFERVMISMIFINLVSTSTMWKTFLFCSPHQSIWKFSKIHLTKMENQDKTSTCLSTMDQL